MHENRLCLVEFIDQRLRETRPPISHKGKIIYGDWFSEELAIKGERVGKWRIIEILDPNNKEKIKPIEEFKPQKREVKTKRVKKKEIAWVQDEVIIGGAELTCLETIRIGEDCGFEIKIITQKSDGDEIREIFNNSDFAIINNIWHFDEAKLRIILNAIYGSGLPYCKFEHDHRELTRPEFSRPLFQRSKLNVFLSPNHRKNYVETLYCDGICLPLAINVDDFYPVETITRKENTALVCNVRNFKSWNKLQNFIDSHPKIEFTILTNTSCSVKGPNVQYRRMVRYEEMPAVYSEFQYLVHLLDGWGAGERVIFEGALCGCEVISDERAGHMSWGKDLKNTEELREWLRQAPYDFWKEIDIIT